MSCAEYLRSFAVPVALVALGIAVAAVPPPAPSDGIAATQCAALSLIDSAGSILAELVPASAARAFAITSRDGGDLK